MSRPTLPRLFGSTLLLCLLGPAPLFASAPPVSGPVQLDKTNSPTTGKPVAPKHSEQVDPQPVLSTDPDFERYLTAQGLELLQLRESLEGKSKTTTASCKAWWKRMAPTATSPQKERVLALWAQVDPPGCAAAIGQVLQQRWSALPPDSFIDCERNQAHHERLCRSLMQLGSAAAQPFLSLASNPRVPKSGRAHALEQLAQLAPPDWLTKIAKEGLSEPSDAELRDPLRRSLLRRARADAKARVALNQGIQTLLRQEVLPETLTLRLWSLLGELSEKLDPRIYQSLAQKVADAQVPVPQRVVYARLLSKQTPGRTFLERAMASLYRKVHGPSANSLVLAQALQALPESSRQAFLNKHPAWLSQDPKLAVLAWRDAQLPGPAKVQHAFIRTGLHSIWPEVQAQALARMQGPCSRKNLRKAIALAGPQSRKGSPDRTVRRAAIDAMARCKDARALRKLRRLADNDAVSAFDRGRALRRYIEQSPVNESTAKRVREVVRRAPNELGRSALFLGMGQLTAPPEYVVQELCLWAKSKRPRIMRTSAKKAQAALSRLKRQQDCKGAAPTQN